MSFNGFFICCQGPKFKEEKGRKLKNHDDEEVGMAMGRVWGGDPIPLPRPVIPTPPRSRGNFLPLVLAPQGTHRYPPRPNINFYFLFIFCFTLFD